MIRLISVAVALGMGSPAGAQIFEPAFPQQANAPRMASVAVEATQIASGLENPWAITQMRDGRFLVTERPGRLRIVGADGAVSEPIAGVPEVHAVRQGGLLDVALSPDFAEDRRVFLTWAKPLGNDFSVTAAGHGRLSADGAALEDFIEIWAGGPPSPTPLHYGSRIVPVDDGTVWITTGDRASRAVSVPAQDVTTSYGKVIRVTWDGDPVPGNPFLGGNGDDTVWSYGHRNIQSAALDGDGLLWTIEHGPRGGDELNQPQAGANYGWPVVSYGENYDGTPVGSGEPRGDGFEEPVYWWNPVIAPGGMIIHSGQAVPEWAGDIFVGGLAVGALVRLELEDGLVVGEERLLDGIGRVRDVAEMADGRLAIVTDAVDGGLYVVAPER